MLVHLKNIFFRFWGWILTLWDNLMVVAATSPSETSTLATITWRFKSVKAFNSGPLRHTLGISVQWTLFNWPSKILLVNLPIEKRRNKCNSLSSCHHPPCTGQTLQCHLPRVRNLQKDNRLLPLFGFWIRPLASTLDHRGGHLAASPAQVSALEKLLPCLQLVNLLFPVCRSPNLLHCL